MTKRKRYVLINDFHNSEAYVFATEGVPMTARQTRNVWRRLCGIQGCQCSNYSGVRGVQDRLGLERNYDENDKMTLTVWESFCK